jgi:hypothetical protein
MQGVLYSLYSIDLPEVGKSRTAYRSGRGVSTSPLPSPACRLHGPETVQPGSTPSRPFIFKANQAPRGRTARGAFFMPGNGRQTHQARRTAQTGAASWQNRRAPSPQTTSRSRRSRRAPTGRPRPASGRSVRLITSQNDTAPKLLTVRRQVGRGLITSQNDTAPKQRGGLAG